MKASTLVREPRRIRISLPSGPMNIQAGTGLAFSRLIALARVSFPPPASASVITSFGLLWMSKYAST